MIEILPYLLIPSLIFYLLGILILILILKNHLTGKYDNKDIKFVPSRIIRLSLVVYSIIAVTPFFGLYQQFIRITPIPSFYDMLILSIIFGGLIFIVCYILIRFLINFNQFTLKSKSLKVNNYFKYSLIILIILLPASIFSFQSVATINNNEFKPNDLSQTIAISPDLTKEAFIGYKPNDINSEYPYLFVKMENQSFTSIYPLCSEIKFCGNIYPTLNIKFNGNNNILLFETINNYDVPLYIYTFDLISKKISNEFTYDPYNNTYSLDYQILNTNSTPYIGYIMSYFTNGTREYSLNVTNIVSGKTLDYNFNYSPNQLLYILYPSYTISPDFTKLCVIGVSQVNGSRYAVFYRISGNQLLFLKQIALPNFYHFYFLPWTENSSVIYYSFDGYGKDFTTLGSFNYNGLTSELTTLSNNTSIDITSINRNESIVLGNSNEIYSYKGSNITLIRTLGTVLLSGSDMTWFLTTQNSDAYLYNYNPLQNTLYLQRSFKVNFHSSSITILGLFLNSIEFGILFIVIVTILSLKNSKEFKI